MSAEVLFDLASTSSLPFSIEVKEEIKDGIYNIITPVGEISVCNDTNAGHYFSEASKDDCLEDVLEFIESQIKEELQTFVNDFTTLPILFLIKSL